MTVQQPPGRGPRRRGGGPMPRPTPTVGAPRLDTRSRDSTRAPPLVPHAPPPPHQFQPFPRASSSCFPGDAGNSRAAEAPSLNLDSPMGEPDCEATPPAARKTPVDILCLRSHDAQRPGNTHGPGAAHATQATESRQLHNFPAFANPHTTTPERKEGRGPHFDFPSHTHSTTNVPCNIVTLYLTLRQQSTTTGHRLRGQSKFSTGAMRHDRVRAQRRDGNPRAR